MKRSILTISVLWKVWLVYGQSAWFPNDASWINTYDNNASNGYTKTIVAGDTDINGISCRKISSTNVQQYFIDQSIHYFYSVAYVYEANSSVYIFDPEQNTFDTLYNFIASPGDTLGVYSTWFSDIKEIVLDTGTLFISNVPLKYQSVQYLNPYWSPVEIDTLLEKIGSRYLGILHPDLGLQFGMETFCSYTDELLGTYSPTGADCDSLYTTLYFAGSEDIKTKNIFSIFPNPARNQIQLLISKSFTDRNMELRITDETGTSVITMKELPSFIDISGFSSGIFSLILTTNHEVWKSSFVKL